MINPLLSIISGTRKPLVACILVVVDNCSQHVPKKRGAVGLCVAGVSSILQHDDAGTGVLVGVRKQSVKSVLYN